MVSQSQPVTATADAATSGAEPSAATPLQNLELVCEDIFDRWDADMRSGKLLSALSGRVPNYDPRVTAIRGALAAFPDLVATLQSGLAAVDAASASCPVRSARASPEHCPRCDATDRQSCGLNVGALDRLETALRAALAKVLGAPDVDTSHASDEVPGRNPK